MQRDPLSRSSERREPQGFQAQGAHGQLTSELREPFSTCLVRAITSVPQVFTFSVRSPFTDWPNRACESGVPVAITSARGRLLTGDGESPGPKEPRSGRKRRGVYFFLQWKKEGRRRA